MKKNERVCSEFQRIFRIIQEFAGKCFNRSLTADAPASHHAIVLRAAPRLRGGSWSSLCTQNAVLLFHQYKSHAALMCWESFVVRCQVNQISIPRFNKCLNQERLDGRTYSRSKRSWPRTEGKGIDSAFIQSVRKASSGPSRGTFYGVPCLGVFRVDPEKSHWRLSCRGKNLRIAASAAV